MPNRSELLINIGKRIRQLRKEQKLTILALASLCATSEKHLGQLERGKSNITLELLVQIAEVLKVSPQSLLIEEKENLQNFESNKKNTSDMKKIIYTLIDNADEKSLERIYKVVLACKD